MSFNPFEQRGISLDQSFESWTNAYPVPYHKDEVDPYTKVRIILMNGTELEAERFSHRFNRSCTDMELRRELALIRRIEQQQQKKLALLKPANESILEHTISYEQLAVDLTAILAQREPDCYVKAALDFALLEDFDHLYRYANLLEMESGVFAERLVGGYTEIMPGRPTVAGHRHPFDNVRRFLDKKAAMTTKLAAMIITAAEQQTMNYYMNVVNLYPTDIGRRLYQEIGLIEEQHVTQYESLQDPNSTWLENLLLHEYVECYLYWSCYMDESSSYVKSIWEEHLLMEISHLKKAAELLKKYEGKEVCEVIPDPVFPERLSFHQNIEYVRGVLRDTVQYTAKDADYLDVAELPEDASYWTLQKQLNANPLTVPSHAVINKYLCRNGIDYRYEVAPHPIGELQGRRRDNITVGRTALDIPQARFECNPVCGET